MNSLLMFGLIGLIGFFCQWLSQQVKLPAILFLLLSGILLGPVMEILDPNQLFGDVLFPFISLSVAVILFEGALTLKRKELKEIGTPVRRMVSVGVVINGAIMTVATHYLIGLSWSLSALFGAVMVVTGPTVIMPMLKTVRPLPKIADVLRWEGIVIDPIGALIAVLVYEWISVQHQAAEVSEVFTVFGSTVLVGMAVGLGVGYVFGVLLRHHWIPEKLHNYAALAVVCFAFAISDSMMHESGLLAVTVMGMLLANMKDVHINAILEFKEDLTIVFVSALFIVLAARLNFAGFEGIVLGAFILLLVMQFVARPLKVFASFLGSGFNWREKAMVAWIGPRGIVAAAVSAVFALRLEEMGVEQADLLVPLSFSIIIGTVVLQSLTARKVATWLKVAMPKTHGVVIIGANPFSIALARAFDKADVQTIVCDTNWDSLRAARHIGLNTYYGNPSSEHAEMHLNLSPYGMMLGLSGHFEHNVSLANVFDEDFGVRNVFVLRPNHSSERLHKHVVSPHARGRLLFTEPVTFSVLYQHFQNSGTVKMTELSENYPFAAWRSDNPQALLICTLRPNGEMLMNTEDQALEELNSGKLFYVPEFNQGIVTEDT